MKGVSMFLMVYQFDAEQRYFLALFFFTAGLAFHGVHYKNQSWHAYVKKDKIRYVGIFGSMLEAIKAYDMYVFPLSVS